MKNARIRPRLASIVAVAAIGAISFGLTGAGAADAGNNKAKPPAPTPTDQPVATMTIHPDGGEAFSVPVDSLQGGVGVGVSAPVGGTRETSTPSVSEIIVTHKTDAYSPILFRYITTGTNLPNVELTGSLPDGTPFEYELANVIISGLSTSAGGTTFSDSVSLNFTRIRTTVGTNSASYDLATSKTG